MLLCSNLSCLAILLSALGSPSQDAKVPASAQANEKPHSIPLQSVYAVAPQMGLKRIIDNPEVPKSAETLFRDFRGGASNVFLVQAEDIGAAVLASRPVLVGGRPADRPSLQEGDPIRLKPSKRLWVVAYLGKGPSGPTSLLKGVERSGYSIRVSYAKQESDNRDVRSYLLWIPVGDLKAGNYRLELYDADERAVTMSRRVTLKGS